MLDIQLEHVRKVMHRHRNEKKRRIVFIHGKGEGVLRKAVMDLIKKEYPKALMQDASFQEYGFGATEVIIY
ncbi:Smr/MutS family protein [Porphyromonas cangingivalis]|nr:Smr/MutS family protein [Porphyromonas cangingivalis]